MTPIVMNQNHCAAKVPSAPRRPRIYEGPSPAEMRLLHKAVASLEGDVEICNFAEEDARAERAANLKSRLVFWGIVAVIGLALVAWKVLG